MKRLALSAAVVLSLAGVGPRPAAADEKLDKSSCSFKGKHLFGKIQVVKAFPDVKVQVVKAFPDKCGQWEMVDAFPDTKVQFVDAFPDVKIEYVDAFPGTP